MQFLLTESDHLRNFESGGASLNVELENERRLYCITKLSQLAPAATPRFQVSDTATAFKDVFSSVRHIN
jgi:hypothetical protein